MIIKKHKIGGDIPVETRDLKGVSSFSVPEEEIMFSNGRTALMAILSHIARDRKQKKKIYLPYYICHSAVNSCHSAGFTVEFYELDKSFLFPLTELDNLEPNTALLTVNYFGFIDDNPTVEEVAKARPDILTISDRVQDFYSLKNSKAGFSFTSLRKTFSIPEGGLVFTMRNDFLDDFSYPENNFYKDKFIGSFLKSEGSDDADYLYFFKKGEQLLDESNRIEKASMLSQYLYHKYNFSEAQKIRKQNYKFIYEEGNKIGLNFIFEYTDNITPLSIPVLIEDRDNVRINLLKNNIFLPVHWPLCEFNKHSFTAENMAKHEVSLVIDQRYNLADMKYQLNFLKKLIPK